MKSEQKMVMDFMLKFQQEVKTQPAIPSPQVLILRANLIMEEVFELLDAMGLDYAVVGTSKTKPNYTFSYNDKPCDIVKVADGLADIHYVADTGTALAFGIDMEPIFNEVHRSNMSKLWTESELQSGKEKYPDCVAEDYGGGLYRLRRADGKTIKSPSYSPADIEPILLAQGWRKPVVV